MSIQVAVLRFAGDDEEASRIPELDDCTGVDWSPMAWAKAPANDDVLGDREQLDGSLTGWPLKSSSR
jgi:hypothetical protein